MKWGVSRRNLLAGAALCLSLVTGGAGPPPQEPAPESLFDIRLAGLRRASVAWEGRRGPTRVVVDQVCLVPDLPTFFEAIAAWDEAHWFPVLLEDAESSARFVRAFRPARIVRLPPSPHPIDAGGRWEAAARAVERSWTSDDEQAPIPAGSRPRTVAVPQRLGRTPPGLVLASPSSPCLAAAVGLAAGRFQTLAPWSGRKDAGQPLEQGEAETLAHEVESAVASAAPRYAALGDDCDFLTLAADLPDRYRIAGGTRHGLDATGVAAIDDRLGRDRKTGVRWAYAGRVVGDPSSSVYRAMCGLFLQPRSALLFDAYNPATPGFADYPLKPACDQLQRALPCRLVQGKDADLDGWRTTFTAGNRDGLVYLNSSGSPTSFNLMGGRAGSVADVPPTVPAVVLVNHSFSAAHPEDADTLAGRWLDRGAFLYYGSLNEPYLQAFRTPRLVADLLAEGLPVSASVRMLPGQDPAWTAPWRLTLVGDPLYAISRRSTREPRLATWAATDSWKALAEEPPPDPMAPDSARLDWAYRANLLDAAREDDGLPRAEVESALLAIRRDRLPPAYQARYDGMAIDRLFRPPERFRAWIERLEAIPEPGRPAAVRRALETARAFGKGGPIRRGR